MIATGRNLLMINPSVKGTCWSGIGQLARSQLRQLTTVRPRLQQHQAAGSGRVTTFDGPPRGVGVQRMMQREESAPPWIEYHFTGHSPSRRE